jgi:hypothetical protein
MASPKSQKLGGAPPKYPPKLGEVAVLCSNFALCVVGVFKINLLAVPPNFGGSSPNFL